MSIDSILNSNDIILSVQRTYWSKEDLYWNDAKKTYIICIQNNKLNIKKKFDFKWSLNTSPEDILVGWLISIAASLSGWSRYVDSDGNIIADPNDEYVQNFGESLMREINEIVSLKRDLEEVIGDCIPEILGYMAHSDRRDCRGYAAFFPACPKEAIKKLMTDNDDWVRGMALKHPHAKGLAAFI